MRKLKPMNARVERSPERRPNFRERGYTSRWDRLRKIFLLRHPLCAECLRQGRTRAASVVDHIVPHRGDRELFWNEENWQSLCGPCHTAKTARGE